MRWLFTCVLLVVHSARATAPRIIDSLSCPSALAFEGALPTSHFFRNVFRGRYLVDLEVGRVEQISNWKPSAAGSTNFRPRGYTQTRVVERNIRFREMSGVDHAEVIVADPYLRVLTHEHRYLKQDGNTFYQWVEGDQVWYRTRNVEPFPEPQSGLRWTQSSRRDGRVAVEQYEWIYLARFECPLPREFSNGGEVFRHVYVLSKSTVSITGPRGEAMPVGREERVLTYYAPGIGKFFGATVLPTNGEGWGSPERLSLSHVDSMWASWRNDYWPTLGL